ncbi:MAG: hypothetical protein WCS27_16840 [Victivallaceae bacterium]|jgi:hypothetical protein
MITEIFNIKLAPLLLFVLIVLISYFSLIFFLLSKMKKRRKEREGKLYKALSKGFSFGTITSVEDVVNIYKGIYQLGADDTSYRADLSKNLRSYLAEIISSRDDKEAVSEIKGKINSIIKDIEKESPYAALPAAERNIIIDIQNFANSNNENSVRAKFNTAHLTLEY